MTRAEAQPLSITSDSIILRVAGASSKLIEAKEAAQQNGNLASHEWAHRAMQDLVTLLANEEGALEALKELQK